MNSKAFLPGARSIRSFVIREGRFTAAQKQAIAELWPRYGIPVGETQLAFDQFFFQQQPVIMDVGFGNGDSLLALARQREDLNFIGVEVYRPGIGNVLRRLQESDIKNVRIINQDIQQVLQTNTPSNSLRSLLVWFPDPWPKKRHHKRRLVQKEFLHNAIDALEPRGILHLASDWQPYVESMRLSAAQCFQLHLIERNTNPLNIQRPLTRFERRGLRLGHQVSDLLYQVNK